jgi:hypothetical protein
MIDGLQKREYSTLMITANILFVAVAACMANGFVQVAPVSSPIANAKQEMGVSVSPYSLTSFDLLLEQSKVSSTVAKRFPTAR